VTSYGSFEEMMGDLGRAMKEADARVRPAQAEIKPGQYFINLRYGTELPIFGEILDTRKLGYDEEKQEYIDLQYTEPHMRFYRPTRCYSAACPEGEVGDTHLSNVDAIIDKELFEHYRENEWYCYEIRQLHYDVRLDFDDIEFMEQELERCYRTFSDGFMYKGVFWGLRRAKKAIKDLKARRNYGKKQHG